jgi:aspartate-semialdehyde dehydrogenase
MRVGVFGATGQVGQVMRALLEERDFPLDEVRFFSSAKSAGRTIPFKGKDVTVEDTATADFSGLDIATDVRRRHHVARVRPQGRRRSARPSSTTRRPGARTRRAAGRQRGQPRGRDQPAQGHHRQPELHHHGRDAGAQAAARRRRPVSASSSPPTRPSRARGQGRRGAGRPRSPRSTGPPPELASTARPWAPATPPPTWRPIAYNVVALAGSHRRRRLLETDEEQKLRNESRKILHLPELLVSGTCVRVPVFTGHSLSHQRRVRADDHPREATALLADAPGVQLVEVPTPRRRRPAPTTCSSGVSARTRPSPASAVSCCS